jgi:hypothetical protein
MVDTVKIQETRSLDLEGDNSEEEQNQYVKQ